MEKVVCEICGRNFKTGESLNQHKNAVHREFITMPVQGKKLAKGKIIGLFSVILLVLALGYFSFTSFTGRVAEPGVYDEFAQCLTEKGATFYGAFWCPHCKEQKELFGSSSKFLNYVECDPAGKNAQPELCKKVGIRGFPTWIINETKYEGVQSLQKLSELTGCQINQQ